MQNNMLPFTFCRSRPSDAQAFHESPKSYACYDMLCCAVTCYAMLCYVMPREALEQLSATFPGALEVSDMYLQELRDAPALLSVAPAPPAASSVPSHQPRGVAAPPPRAWLPRPLHAPIAAAPDLATPTVRAQKRQVACPILAQPEHASLSAEIHLGSHHTRLQKAPRMIPLRSRQLQQLAGHQSSSPRAVGVHPNPRSLPNLAVHHAVLCYAMLCYSLLCCAVLCYAVLRCASLPMYAMLATLRYAILP